VHPYRTRPPTAPGDGAKLARAARYLASKKRLAAACLTLGAIATLVPLVSRLHRAGQAPAAPPELLTAGSVFPAPALDLPPSVPLAPLLAADAPEQLAVVEPSENALNVRMGEPLTIRFNRPMVDGAHVGKPAEGRVLVFQPPVAGKTVWTSRSAASFAPALGTWSRTHVASMSIAPELRSLAGESPAEFEPRTVVFDTGPRLAHGPRVSRLVAGEPASLLFSGHVQPPALHPLMMAYEVGGGRRALPFTLAGRGRDAEGRTRVDVFFGTTLEPGANFAIALSPNLADMGSHPRVFELEMAPRPKVEGIACPSGATEATQCDFQGPPGRIVDIEESLRLLSSEELDATHVPAVRASPALANLTVRIEGQKLLVVRGDWAPGQVYEVRLGEVRDAAGHVLAATAPLAVRSAGRAPQVRAASGWLAFERDARAELGFAAIHVDAGEARVAQVGRGDEIAAALHPVRWVTPGAGKASAISLASLAPSARPNRWGRGALAWHGRGEPGDGAMAVLSLLPDKASVESEDPPATFAQQTDLGVDAKRLAGGARVWVTSIATGRPVAGASVDVADAEGDVQGRATTDDRGVAWVPLPPEPLAAALPVHGGAAHGPARNVAVVRVTLGDDRAVVVVDGRKAIGPQHLGIAPGEAPPPPGGWLASVLTDRGIVRPGETVHARALVRAAREDGTLVGLDHPTAVEAELLLFGPTDEAPLARHTGKLSAFGSLDADFPVGADAQPGAFRVEVHAPGDRRVAGSTSFTVGEYEPPALRVDVATPAQDLEDRDPLHLEVTAVHMFGSPAAGLAAHWTVEREAGNDYPPRWAPYAFDAVGTTSKSGTMAAGDVLLDAAGRVSLVTPIAMGGGAREQAVFEIDVRDPSGRTTSARHTVSTYRARHEVGVRRTPAWLEHGTTLDVDAVVIEHDGTPSPGRKVRARILRESWHTYWEWSRGTEEDDGDTGDGGAAAGVGAGTYQTRRAHRTEVVRTCDLVSTEAAVHCTWRADRPGTYVLEASSRDEAGRTSIASQRVYVAGPDEHPDRDPPGTAVQLTPSKATWNVGETADVAFESPFDDAEALLEVERQGVLATETRHVSKGGQVFRFAVSKEMVPNAFVSLSLVKGRTAPPGAKVDLGAPDLRVGLAEIAVRPSTAPLDVRVDVAERAPAGTDVPIDVRVSDAAGAGVAAEVTLYAVDEATLRVTGYRTPDPVAGLLPRLPPAFAWEDLRRALVSRIAEPLPAEAGGDGDSTPAKSRARDVRDAFDPTVLWLPHERTDAGGHVRATMHLPSRAATYRVMAVAVDEGARAGRAERATVASMPVVLRPALPAFATVGDRFEAAVLVHNTETTARDVTVITAVEGGARQEAPAHLEPNGEVRVAQWVDVAAKGAAGSSRAQRGESSDSNTYEDIRLRFEVGGASLEARVPVRARGREARSEVVGAVQGSRDVAIVLPDGSQDVQLTLSIARHPFVGLDTALDALLAAPDAGIEPIASSLLGLASWSRLDTGKRPSSVRPEELRARATSAIARLFAAQHGDGGFSMFEDDGSDGYLTAYVTHALCAARDAGFAVDEERLHKAVAVVAVRVQSSAFLDSSGGTDDLAFALRTLAEAGARDEARIGALFAQRERLSPYGLAQLAMAMEASDLRRDTLVVEAVHYVLATREDERTNRRLLRWYDGSARTIGAVLEAASATPRAAQPTTRLASILLRTRSESEAAWSSTHETSHALAALAAYAATFPEDGGVEARVAVDGVTVKPSDRSAAIAVYRLPAGRSLHVEVDGTAYFALAGRWVQPLGDGDKEARGAKVTLHRVLEDATGKPLGNDAHVRLGDLVRVRLFLYTESASPPPPYVTIRDPLGGGLEPIEAAHDTSPHDSLWALLGMSPDDDVVDARGVYASRSLGDLTERAFLPQDAAFQLAQAGSGLREYTYGVRASAVGTFVLPPAQVRALYAGHFDARSAMATITVEP
jgi:uncharacterized protein YfaS (alpha-2-macroglobulin family)